MADVDVVDDVKRVLEQRRESLEWLRVNYYDEFAEVYRAAQCRTEAIMVKNSAGKMVEDKTRTNVAMPDISVAIRRGTARLTANPPQINYICEDQAVADKLTTWSYMSFDRTREAGVQTLHIQQAKTFGISVTKTFWKSIEPMQVRRFQRSQLTNRAAKMKLQGYNDADIQAAVAEKGPTIAEPEIAADIAANGTELRAKVPVRKYDGPAVKFIFIGDYFPEPGFHPHGTPPGYEIEQFIGDEQWLSYWKDQTFLDEKGVENKVFDPKACDELLESDFQPKTAVNQIESLREQLFAVSGKSSERLTSNPKLVKGKRFLIYERHEMRKGEMWITWVANETILLGEMPYPWDLEGRSLFDQLVLLPDLIMGVGDSTPRLGRFLYRLHNAAVGQRTDLISNILRRPVFIAQNEPLPDPIERAQFRIYQVKNVNDIKFAQEAEVPNSAWETENQVLKMFGLLEPNLTNMETGTNLNPGVGRTATAATLSQKSSDAMLQYELSGYNLYLRSVSEKKLWMMQQMMQEDAKLPARYQMNSDGDKSDLTLTPWEIQDDIDVEPEVGSTLSVDDEFRRMNAQNMYQLAVGNPEVWNVYEAAKEYAKTIRGVDPKKVINAPAPPPKPEPKMSVTMQVKFDDLPADAKTQLLSSVGLQVNQAELQTQDALKAAIQTGKAADAAGKLTEPAAPPQGGQVATQ